MPPPAEPEPDLSAAAAFFTDGGFTTPPIGQPDGSTKTYRVPEPNAEIGLRLVALYNVAASVATDAKPTAADTELVGTFTGDSDQVDRDVLGPVYDELIADGVSVVIRRRLARYALLKFAAGDEAAAEYARGAAAGEPSAPTANRQARRASSSRRSGSAAARKTPGRGSPASSTSPRKPGKPSKKG